MANKIKTDRDYDEPQHDHRKETTMTPAKKVPAFEYTEGVNQTKHVKFGDGEPIQITQIEFDKINEVAAMFGIEVKLAEEEEKK